MTCDDHFTADPAYESMQRIQSIVYSSRRTIADVPRPAQRLSAPSPSSPFEVCCHHLKPTFRIGRTASLEVWAHLTPQMRIAILGRSPSMCIQLKDASAVLVAILPRLSVSAHLENFVVTVGTIHPMSHPICNFSFFRKRCMIPTSQECLTLQAIAYHLHQRVQKLIQRILKNMQALKTTSLSSRLEVV